MADNLFLCALHRMTFLTLPEKLLMMEMFSDAEDLKLLGIGDIERYIGRRLRKPNWDPDAVIAFARDDVRFCETADIRILCYREAGYPARLYEIFDPPFLLFLRGRLPGGPGPAAAVVGTRRPTGSAVKAVFSLCLELGAAGVPVISGLARGIDTAAHDGCVKAGGESIAVLGTGVDAVYPKENRELARAVLECGALISEYPPGTPPLAYNFPNRNRIISGLASVVVIAQAPERSGALITADYALDQGRDVVVLQEGLAGREGQGTAKLREDGAEVIRSAKELLTMMEVPVCGTGHSWGGTERAPFAHPSVGQWTGAALAMNLEDEILGNAHVRYGEYFRRM